MSRVGSLRGIQDVIARCAFADLRFEVRLDGERPYLQIIWAGIDNRSGNPKELAGRKWFLSNHMTRSEVVQTAFAATLFFVEHEARETFKYDGQSIFDPHYDVDALVRLRSIADGGLDTRTQCEERAA